MERRGTFDYILLETTGLADPGNIAPLFWVDEGLGSSIYLDGVVTLVDARNVILSLDEHGNSLHETTAHLQISHADVIIINKTDLVTKEHLKVIEQRVRAINGLAKIQRTQYGQLAQLEGLLLDLHAYNGIDTLDSPNETHSHLDPVCLYS